MDFQVVIICLMLQYKWLYQHQKYVYDEIKHSDSLIAGWMLDRQALLLLQLLSVHLMDIDISHMKWMNRVSNVEHNNGTKLTISNEYELYSVRTISSFQSVLNTLNASYCKRITGLLIIIPSQINPVTHQQKQSYYEFTMHQSSRGHQSSLL